MVIGIDYTAAAWQGAGIGRYTRGLVRAAVAQDTTLRYVLFYAAGGLPPSSPYLADLHRLCSEHPHVRAAPIPLSPRLLTILWQRLHVPLMVERFTGPLDVLHAPDFVLPPTRARRLMTIHDLTFLVRPECFEPTLQRYLARVVPRSLHRANRVLADSEASRADIVRLLHADSSRVEVIYPGIDPQFRPLPASATEPVRQRLGLPAGFLLFVGTLEPRKNLVRLLNALPLLPDNLPLVVAGRKGWLYTDIFDTVQRLGVQSQVYFLDFVHDTDLPALYNQARVFVYPSLYEGFGLPVAEALACGIPTVTSAAASLPEVAGDAAILIDPLNVQAIAEGIRQALDQADRLRTAGPMQVQQFTWEQAARRLLTCYQDVG